MRTKRFLSLLGLALGAVLLSAVDANGHILIFHDGFMVNGKVQKPGAYRIDPGTGTAVFMTKGVYILDAGARRIFFSPHQVPAEGVLDSDPVPESELVTLKQRVYRSGPTMEFPLTQIIGASDWTGWERTFKINYPPPYNRFNVTQKLGLLTPQYLRVDALKRTWSAYYMTTEFSPATVRSLLYSYPELKSDSARMDSDWRFKVYLFLVQAGWLDQAEEELNAIVKDNPNEKEKADGYRKSLKERKALQLFDAIERAHQAGQFRWVEANLARFPHQVADQRAAAGIRSLKASYETARDNLGLARRLLKDLPPRTRGAHQEMFTEAADVILESLDMENVVRLDAFLTLGSQAERDGKQNEKTVQDPAQLMSLAVSGWLLGKDAAEAKPETAHRLWKARKFLLEYLKADDPHACELLLKAYQAATSDALPIDELAQLIAFLPPPRAERMNGPQPLTLRTPPLSGRNNGLSYLVQLPPEYHIGRHYPVLFVLHQVGERPQDMLARVSVPAAQHGYLVVSPACDYARGVYGFTPEEHEPVTEVIRDVRRRFQVDSDRVFLMGGGEGGMMAFDVGLAHPDLFAGVLPVAGCPAKHAERYWPNAQYLPFYVADGDMSGDLPSQNKKAFEKWVPFGFPAIYVQYKGRGVEWFAGELPMMFDWMDHKKEQFRRARALPEVGRLGGSLSQEFQTMRSSDTRFYWLTTDGIRAGHTIDDGQWSNRILPATLQASLREGSINVTVRNLKQVSVWLTRDMIDFTKPLTVRVNGSIRWNNRRVTPSLVTMLEDLYVRADRQRLYWAKLDFDRP
jgi:hypothetical protein